jgi:hypothetical protein
MKTITLKKAIIKMREDKIAVHSFLQGNAGLESLTLKNIKFFKPI